MTFFNKKEEVIEIELTQFGKILHSRGKLKPSYYAFYDDDIIYDDAYGSSDNDAEDRIEETPRQRVQANFTSVDDTTNMSEENPLASYMASVLAANQNSVVGQDNRDANTKRQQEKTSHILIQEQKRRNTKPPIGTSANDTLYHPAWRAIMLGGELESTTPYIDDSPSVINIPQMEVKKREYTSKAIRGTDDNSFLYGYTFPDGSSVTLKEGEDSEFLLFLQEKNASSDTDNFTVEVYQVEESSGKEFLTPLSFAKRFPKDRIVNGIIVDNDGQLEELDPNEDPTLVGYYFDLELDEEIDPTILSDAMAGARLADIRDLESFANMRTLPDGNLAAMRKGTSATDIYGLSLTEIANMTDEAIEAAENRSGGREGLYDEEDNTNECD